MKKLLFGTLLLLSSVTLSAGDDFCGIRNTAFQAGEITTFKVYYTLGVYIAAGEATFAVNLEKLNNKPVYHIKQFSDSANPKNNQTKIFKGNKFNGEEN